MEEFYIGLFVVGAMLIAWGIDVLVGLYALYRECRKSKDMYNDRKSSFKYAMSPRFRKDVKWMRLWAKDYTNNYLKNGRE